MTKVNSALVRKSWVALALLGALASLPGRAAGAAPFSDVTTSSGIKALDDAAIAAALAHVPPDDSWISGISFVDLDSDGNLDLFLSSHHGWATMGVNNGAGHFTAPPGGSTFPSSEVHCTYDINDDGWLDMSMTYGDGGGKWWVNKSTGPGVIAMSAQNANWGGARQQSLVDINKDGKVDWLVGEEHVGLSFNYGDGTGTFAKDSKVINWNDATVDGITPMAIDINNTGSKDLIVEWGRYDYPNGRCRIYQNDGNGNFTDVTTAVGLYQDNLAIMGVGDFNQDGYTDIIAIENAQFPPSIFLNDHNGHFIKKAGAVTGGPTGKLTYTGWGMTSMTDIDNDGIPDIIMGGRNYTRVYRGTGGGNFTYMSTTWGLNTDGEAAVDATYGFGDIDHDGKLEIAIIPQNEIPILYHNDLPAKNWINVRPVGLAGNKGAAGAKIRIFAPGTNTLLWYEEVIIYCKQAQQNYYAYPVTERHYGLGTRTSVDIEVEFYRSGKKVKHFAVAVGGTQGATGTEIISESETPGGQPPATQPAGKFTIVTPAAGVQTIQAGFATGDKVSGLHLIDLNADNKLDLYVSMHGQGTAVAALNSGLGVFTKATGTGFPKSEVRLPYDINENGKIDLAMIYQDGGAQWWTNQSTTVVPGGLAFTTTNITRNANTARQSALIDLNKDGKVDWLRGAAPGVVFDYGDGLGGFADSSASLDNTTSGDGSIFPIDLDNSGVISLIVQWGGTTIANGKSRIYRNDGALSFSNVTAAAGLSEDVAIKGVGDYNQDGYSDLLVLENNRTTWSIYLNDGHGHFTKKANAISGVTGTVPTYASLGLAACTDFDNDGIGDLLVSCRPRLLMLRGTGGGSFMAMNSSWAVVDQSSGLYDDGLCFGDIDGDGMLDVIGYNGSLATNPTHFDVYHNGLAKKNFLNVRPVGLAGNKGAAGAKIRLYVPGGALLNYEQVQLIGKQGSTNYYNFASTERHFGLGTRTKVDVTVEFYPSGKVIQQKNVSANSTVVITETP